MLNVQWVPALVVVSTNGERILHCINRNHLAHIYLREKSRNQKICRMQVTVSNKHTYYQRTISEAAMKVVKTGSSRSGTDERGKCDNVGLSAACPSNEATIRSVVVAVA